MHIGAFLRGGQELDDLLRRGPAPADHLAHREPFDRRKTIYLVWKVAPDDDHYTHISSKVTRINTVSVPGPDGYAVRTAYCDCVLEIYSFVAAV